MQNTYLYKKNKNKNIVIHYILGKKNKESNLLAQFCQHPGRMVDKDFRIEQW